MSILYWSMTNSSHKWVKEYSAYFNQERPHQGIGQRIPDHYPSV